MNLGVLLLDQSVKMHVVQPILVQTEKQKFILNSCGDPKVSKNPCIRLEFEARQFWCKNFFPTFDLKGKKWGKLNVKGLKDIAGLGHPT